MNSFQDTLYSFTLCQLTSLNQQPCYKHQSDTINNHVLYPKQTRDRLKFPEQSDIISYFHSAQANIRLAILEEILSICCTSEIVFLHHTIQPLLRFDFIAILPSEITNAIFSLLDLKSLSRASQVSHRWRHQALFDRRLWLERNWRHPHYDLYSLNHPGGVIWCLQMNDSFVMTGSNDALVRVWDINTGSLLRTLAGHTAPITSLQFDSIYLITGSRDKTVKVWDYHSGQCQRTVWYGASITALDLNTSIMAASSAEDRTIRVWNLQERLGRSFILAELEGCVNSVRIFDKGTKLVAGMSDATVRVWDIKTRTCQKIFRGHMGEVMLAIPGPLNDCLQSTNQYNKRKDPDDEGIDLSSYSSSVSSHSSLLTMNSFFDDDDDTTFYFLEEPKYDSSIMLNKKTTPMIVSCSDDNTIRLWDYTTWECVKLLVGHTKDVRSICMDEFHLVSGSDDETIKVWDAQTGQCMYSLEGHNGRVRMVASSQTKIVSATDTGEVFVWDFAKDNKMLYCCT
ncbi:MAG: quinon protein alcohol dehydrogenase-like superfamily [Benjaminiella poitrasii]|nr:MAG: quinon protein alcohol dehydrogenase-like superfamily [Benjaminiella poitrasii]